MTKKITLITFLFIGILGLTGCTNNKVADKPIVNNPAPVGQQDINNNNVTQPNNNAAPDTVVGYTLSDVAKHSSPTDCWLAVNGQVYNVTSYVTQHPGGEKILNGCGKDASSMFATAHNGKPKATDQLPEFLIGNLK
ncbi:MAG: hypothetical protein COX77_02540 [Candidatus Komeilibacteria bacterium CG_4_10_14_0_2_um_filter_37_10]|uniref:Cytochrome b5 heme-binding domain-containing protein n=1 Tax=Candidatus Komeilibacteria bacterium CG_4_10_14_0_2_um_filter_37_10 TaxID=1974470 RepID=A0A2M7VF36_9BACT|nr:MAG: hypothetical protein COX77_02540 [Candidatus Komeilibacteria bacterium CG_4_10_14_0_2_um_filter_37_10]PJA92633.1 MAG: hypothetical protein CO133_02110 [Candidatus Komeilibacteria bacterium CG_4_9_14_3_um_filter_37_5]